MLGRLACCVDDFAWKVSELQRKALDAHRTPSLVGTTSPANPSPPLHGAPQAAGGSEATDTLESQALQLRRSAASLKKWIGAVTKVASAGSGAAGHGDPEVTRRTLEQARDLLDTALDLLGLRQWLSAELVPGVVYGDSAGDSSAAALSYVRLESRHVGLSYDEDRALDFSLAGGLGFQPTLTLVRLIAVSAIATGDAPAQPPISQYKQAFVWEMRPQSQLHFARDQGQLTVFGRAGQALLLNSAELRDGAQGPELASVVGNAGSRSSWFWGGGIGLKVLQNSRSVLHERKDADTPLDFSFTYTYDLRFRQVGAGPILFDKPEHRLGVRLSLNFPLRRSDAGDPNRKDEPSTTSVGFTVEHEFALYGNGVPSATKISFRGDTNLLKLLK